MRASRLDKPLPKEFFANFLAAVASVYPDARLDRESISELYQLAADEWRNGRQLHVIVREVCSCDGKTVYPSAAASQKLSRQNRLARAPQEVKDGEPFGIDQLRDSNAVERLKARIAQLEARISRGSEGIDNLRAAERTARQAGQENKAEKLAATIQNAELGLATLRGELEVALQQESTALANRPWSRARARPAPKLKPPRKRESAAKPKGSKPQEQKTDAKPSKRKKGRPAKKPVDKPKKAKRKPASAQSELGTEQVSAVPNESPAPIVDEDLTAAFLNKLAKRS